MTTIPVVSEIVPDQYALFRWDGLVPGDDGEPVEVYVYGNRTIQAMGTTTNLVLEGNNVPDSFPWYLISSGSLISWNLLIAARPLYANGQSIYDPRFIRPKLGGTITATFVPVNVALFCVARQQ